jgi:hypothetical protein
LTKEEESYTSERLKIKDDEQSQMFGKPCFKISGKAFVSFFQNEMVFNLTGEAHKDALSLVDSSI